MGSSSFPSCPQHLLLNIKIRQTDRYTSTKFCGSWKEFAPSVPSSYGFHEQLSRVSFFDGWHKANIVCFHIEWSVNMKAVVCTNCRSELEKHYELWNNIIILKIDFWLLKREIQPLRGVLRFAQIALSYAVTSSTQAFAHATALAVHLNRINHLDWGGILCLSCSQHIKTWAKRGQLTCQEITDGCELTNQHSLEMTESHCDRGKACN